jgi:hypothetical protein
MAIPLIPLTTPNGAKVFLNPLQVVYIGQRGAKHTLIYSHRERALVVKGTVEAIAGQLQI